MRKLGIVFWLMALALLIAPLGVAEAAGPASPPAAALAQQSPETLTVKMTEQSGSGENGTATITAAGNGVTVMVSLRNGTSTPQPAHIHKGTCQNLDPKPFQPLDNVVNGQSTSTVPVSMADLAKGGYAINVHKSGTEIATYVSCGDIMAATSPQAPGQPGSPPGGETLPFTTLTVPMKAQNGSGEDGTAVITVSGQDQVTVVIELSNGTSIPQPAHIHKGTCANLDPKPAYPLNNVVDGKSQTTVNASLGDLSMQGYAVNVHKSAAEITTYVSCGDISASYASGPAGGQTGGTVGMPRTGNGEAPWMLFGLALLALSLMGAGLTLARRRV